MANLSLRAYARHREANGLPGTTHHAVAKAIEASRLIKSVVRKNGRVFINPVVGDREWAENSMATSQGIQKTTRSKPVKADSKRKASKAAKPKKGAGSDDSEEVEDLQPDPKIGAYTQARAAREVYAARLAKMEFEQKEKKLVSIDSVALEAFKTHRKIRDAFNIFPDRLAPELVMLEEKAIFKILRNECTKLLRLLSRDIYAPKVVHDQ
jgi:hypothetical protein